MAFDSSFTRKDTPEGAEFQVKPAGVSPGALTWLGVLTIFLVPPGFGRELWGMFYVTVPLFGAAWLAAFLDIRKRKRVTILANGKELRVGGVRYPVSGIAELMVKSRGGEITSEAVYSSNTVVVGGAGVGTYTAAAAANITSALGGAAIEAGHATRRAMIQRSYSLMLRNRSGSEPVKLVYGLQHDTAHTLMNDLIDALR